MLLKTILYVIETFISYDIYIYLHCFSVVLECVCSILGTNKSAGFCDAMTGQCPCLPNVNGTSCDECNENHWKIASGIGCEACDCDLVGSYSEQCNKVKFIVYLIIVWNLPNQWIFLTIFVICILFICLECNMKPWLTGLNRVCRFLQAFF